VVVGNTVLVAVWLSVGVLGVVVGLLWLRGVERSRGSSSKAAVPSSRRPSSTVAPEAHEPDALAG
jgi:hypothetical protein